MKKKKFLRRFSLFSLIFAVLPLILSVCVSAAKKAINLKISPQDLFMRTERILLELTVKSLLLKGSLLATVSGATK